MIRLEEKDVRKVKWMCNVRPEGRISAEELRTKGMRECLPERNLQWFGRLERMEENSVPIWQNTE